MLKEYQAGRRRGFHPGPARRWAVAESPRRCVRLTLCLILFSRAHQQPRFLNPNRPAMFQGKPRATNLSVRGSPIKVTSSPSRCAVIATASSPPRFPHAWRAVPILLTTVRVDLGVSQRWHLRAGQSQSPPQERCEAYCAGELCQGNPQFLIHQHRFMHVRLRGGRARSQQPPGQIAQRWRRLIHNYPTAGVCPAVSVVITASLMLARVTRHSCG